MNGLRKLKLKFLIQSLRNNFNRILQDTRYTTRYIRDKTTYENSIKTVDTNLEKYNYNSLEVLSSFNNHKTRLATLVTDDNVTLISSTLDS